MPPSDGARLVARRPTRASRWPRRAPSSAATSRVARAAAEALPRRARRGRRARPPRPRRWSPAASQVVGTRPADRRSTAPTTPSGDRRAGRVAAASSTAGRRLVAVVSILDDKDAAGDAARAAAARATRVVFTRSQQPARAAAGDARVAVRAARRAAGARSSARPARARCARARELAGADGVVLATGSIYLVADLLRPAGAAQRLDAVNRRRRPAASCR